MPFGLVLDKDGNKIKSRSGDSIKLKELLDEGRDRAYKVSLEKEQEQAEFLAEKRKKAEEDGEPLPEEEEEEKRSEEEKLADSEVVGITSIKYFDLKQNRISNYKFDFDKILDPRGDTGVYLLY